MNNVDNRNEILVSVVIPAYNSAKYIRQAIDSVFMQKVPCEVIVVDDASTDHLDTVIADYIKLDYFTFIKNLTNLGVAETRNIGIRAAKGRYIAFLDADDWWYPQKLKKQLRCIQKHACVLCYTGRNLVDENGKELGIHISAHYKVDYNQLLHHNCIACSSVLVERNAILTCAMEHSEYHEDYLTWLRILKKYGSAYATKEVLLFYRMTKNGKSRKKIKSIKMTYGVYRIMKIGYIRSLWLLICHLTHSAVKYSKFIGEK